MNGCTQIPVDYINYTKSIDTNGHCVQLYNTPDCKLGPNVDSIELRRGTPQHNDLDAWHFPIAKAISHCSYKCNDDESLPLPVDDEVHLFNAKFYTGMFTKLNISSDGDCFDLPKEWDGLTESIAISENSCIQIFDRNGCTNNKLNVTRSVPNLSVFKFERITRSMKSCFIRKSTIVEKPSTAASILIEKPQITTTTRPISDTNGLSPLVITVISVVPIVGMLLTAVLILLVLRRCHPYRKILEKLSEKEIQEFLSGYGMNIQAEQSCSTATSNEYSTELLAQNKPYNSEYEVPQSRIEFGNLG